MRRQGWSRKRNNWSQGASRSEIAEYVKQQSKTDTEVLIEQIEEEEQTAALIQCKCGMLGEVGQECMLCGEISEEAHCLDAAVLNALDRTDYDELGSIEYGTAAGGLRAIGMHIVRVG